MHEPSCPIFWFSMKTHMKQFREFMVKFNKTYESKAEEVKRFGIFKSNLKIIEKMNGDENEKAEFGVTMFSDLSGKYDTGIRISSSLTNKGVIWKGLMSWKVNICLLWRYDDCFEPPCNYLSILIDRFIFWKKAMYPD